MNLLRPISFREYQLKLQTCMNLTLYVGAEKLDLLMYEAFRCFENIFTNNLRTMGTCSSLDSRFTKLMYFMELAAKNADVPWSGKVHWTQNHQFRFSAFVDAVLSVRARGLEDQVMAANEILKFCVEGSIECIRHEYIKKRWTFSAAELTFLDTINSCSTEVCNQWVRVEKIRGSRLAEAHPFSDKSGKRQDNQVALNAFRDLLNSTYVADFKSIAGCTELFLRLPTNTMQQKHIKQDMLKKIFSTFKNDDMLLDEEAPEEHNLLTEKSPQEWNLFTVVNIGIVLRHLILAGRRIGMGQLGEKTKGRSTVSDNWSAKRGGGSNWSAQRTLGFGLSKKKKTTSSSRWILLAVNL